MTPEELAEKRERVRDILYYLANGDYGVQETLTILDSQGVKIVDEKEAIFHHGYFPKIYPLTESKK